MCGMLMYVYTHSDPTFWSYLRQRFEHDDTDSLRDVTDGWEYMHHREFLSKQEHVSLLLNTDGVSLFRSSTVSLWPIWLAVNELPSHTR